MIAASRGVLAADPFLPGLSAQEKARRASGALAQADSRALACAQARGESLTATPPVSDLQKAFAARQAAHLEWRALNLQRHLERVDLAMAWVFRIEDMTASQCGPPRPEDTVLRLIERIRTARIQ